MDNDVRTTFASHHQFTESRRHVDADITAFAEETLQMKISQGELLVGSPDIISDVQRALVKGANGM
jgi:hypothetical protein